MGLTNGNQFYGAENLESIEGRPNLNGITSFNNMFKGASKFNSDISHWDIGNITDVRSMFEDASSFNQNLSSWDLCSISQYQNFDLRASSWEDSNKPAFGKPCVLSVSSPNDNTFHGYGDVVSINVEYHRNVIVTGSPKIELVFVNGLKNASYVSGSGTKNLVFNYTIEEGDFSYDLDYNGSNALKLNGGSITADNINASLTLPTGERSLAGLKNITVLDADNLFTSYWDTTSLSSGSSNNKQIKLPLENSGEYDFLVFWGDWHYDNITSWDDPKTTHNYSEGGNYEINILGKLKGFRFNNQGDKAKLKEIRNWGVLNLGNNGKYFRGASNLVSVPGKANLNGTTNLESMFHGATNFNSDINNWSISNVTTMKRMFYKASNFNKPLHKWDVLDVSNMDAMFREARAFNQDLSGWRVCKHTRKPSGFDTNAVAWESVKKPKWEHPCVLSLTSPSANRTYIIDEHVDLSIVFNEKVTVSDLPFVEMLLDTGTREAYYLSGNGTNNLIFRYVVQLGDLADDLDFNGVTALKLDGGSINATDNNFPAVLSLPEKDSLAKNKDIVIESIDPNIPVFGSVWNTSLISNGSSDNKTIKLPLHPSGEYNFTVYWGDTNFDHINTSNFTNASHTYETEGVKTIHIIGTIKGFNFNNSGDRLKLLNITRAGPLDLRVGPLDSIDMGGYFYGVENLKSVPSDLDLTNVKNFSNMFRNAKSFNSNLSLTFENVADMSRMFSNATSFNQNISYWDVSTTTNVMGMFENASSFNQPLNDWDVGKVTDMNKMFELASSFNQPLNEWDVSMVSDMSRMFYSASSFDQDLSELGSLQS